MKNNIKSTTLYRINTMPAAPGEEAETRKFKYSYTEYDETGHLVLEIRYNEDQEVEEKIVNKYDDQGRLIEEISYLDEDEMAEHKAYEWNAAGQIERAYKIYQDGEKDTIHYKRNDKGKLNEKVTIDSYDEEEAREIIEYENDKVKTRKIFEYDELMLEESYDYDDEGKMTGHTKWTIEDEDAHFRNSFDKNGNLLKAQKFNKQEKLISQAEYIFEGEKLNSIVEEDQYSRNTTTLSYDEKGNPTGQVEVNREGKTNNRALRKYNDNQDVIESEVWIKFHGKGLDQHYVLKYEYEYYS